GIRMFRANVNEMNVQPVDFGDELRQSVEGALALAPVVIRSPVVRECLSDGELDALCCVRDRFAVWPSSSFDAASQLGKLLIRKTYLLKWTNRLCLLLLHNTVFWHDDLLSNACQLFDL